MEQTTQAAVSDAVAIAEPTNEQRNAMMHAFSEAEQIVSQLHALPTDVMVRGDAITGVYSIRLFYSRNPLGVMEFATRFDAELTSSPSTQGTGDYFSASIRLQGIDVQAWAVVDDADVEDEPVSHGPVDEDPIVLSLTDKAAEVTG